MACWNQEAKGTIIRTNHAEPSGPEHVQEPFRSIHSTNEPPKTYHHGQSNAECPAWVFQTPFRTNKSDINPNLRPFCNELCPGPACCTTIHFAKGFEPNVTKTRLMVLLGLFLIHQPCNPPKSPGGGKVLKEQRKEQPGCLAFFSYSRASCCLPSLSSIPPNPNQEIQKKKSVKHTLYEANKHI